MIRYGIERDFAAWAEIGIRCPGLCMGFCRG